MINFKDAKKQWETVLPFLNKIMVEYTKDPNLVKHAETLLNKVETKMGRNEFVSEYPRVLHEVLSSDYYYKNRRDIKAEEEEFLQELSGHLDLFMKLAQKAERADAVESEKKEEKRKPNSDETPDLYEKEENFKGRIL